MEKWWWQDVESRDKIIDKIIDKTIKLLDDKEDFCLCKLSIYKNFFSEEEIEEDIGLRI